MLLSRCGCGCGSPAGSCSCGCDQAVTADGVSIVGDGSADGVLRGYRIEPLDDRYVVTRPDGSMYSIAIGDTVRWAATTREITVTHPDGSIEVFVLPQPQYTVAETIFDAGEAFTGGPPAASAVGPLQEITITNPSAVLAMKVLLVADGPTFRLSNDGVNLTEWAAWLDVYRDGVLLTPASSRIDGYVSLPAGAPALAVDYAASGQNYTDTIPAGGSVRYGIQWQLAKYNGVPTSVGVGHCRLSILGSTTE